MSGYAVDLRSARLCGSVLLFGSVALAHLPPGVGLPCPLRTTTGIPCPFCGITTALRQLGGGDLGGSLSAAPLALVLAVLAILAVVGRLPARLTVTIWVIVLPLGAEWLYELARFHVV